jgi:hypothetical protein
MMKETLRAIQTGPLAEIGLLAFLTAFIIILIYAVTLSRSAAEKASRQPLEDDQDYQPTNTP